MIDSQVAVVGAGFIGIRWMDLLLSTTGLEVEEVFADLMIVHPIGGHNEGFPDAFKQRFRAFYRHVGAGDRARSRLQSATVIRRRPSPSRYSSVSSAISTLFQDSRLCHDCNCHSRAVCGGDSGDRWNLSESPSQCKLPWGWYVRRGGER